MTIITLLMMLVVVAVVIKGILMAFAGDWKGLIILVVCLLLAMWILSFFGISLPMIGGVR
jgi:hypothetical protein